jgi:hypothetical protein
MPRVWCDSKTASCPRGHAACLNGRLSATGGAAAHGRRFARLRPAARSLTSSVASVRRVSFLRRMAELGSGGEEGGRKKVKWRTEATGTLTESTTNFDASSLKCPICNMLSMGVRERRVAGHTSRSCAVLAAGSVLVARAGGAPIQRAL